MIPNDFGIIRQANHNLFAMLFPPLTDISEYEFEIIYPEYVADYMWNAAGNMAATTDMECAEVDCSKYDYVLFPASSMFGQNSSRSGVRSTFGTGAINIAVLCQQSQFTAYVLRGISASAPYLCISERKGLGLPVIGFKRHRTDNVNPLGVIQPINPGILQPQVEDPDVQEDLDVQDPEDEQEES